jgi:hypothetical protein
LDESFLSVIKGLRSVILGGIAAPMSDQNPLKPAPTHSRRKVLAVGLASSLASVQTGSGFLFRRYAPVSLDHLPGEWISREGEPAIQNYYRYLESLKLKYLNPLQVIESHAKKRGSVWNTLPPKALWQGMAQTLEAADSVAASLGRSVIEVTSAYRTAAYNRLCPGAKANSWHMRNRALDLRFEISPSSVVSAARKVRNKGVFHGGIGRYGAFTHIDTRGENVDW